MPAWNSARTIERALGSVLSTGGPEIECVVVDDGSTDGTVAVVEAVAARDPRVGLLRSPGNEGVSKARNRALAAARGEWLTFLDADDRLVPGAVGALLAAAEGGDVLAVVGQRVWTDERNAWLSPTYAIPDIQAPGRGSLAERPGLVNYASATGKLFHRSLTAGLAFEGRVLGDQPWTIRALIRAGDGIRVIGDVVYEWVRPSDGGPSSITAAKYGSARLAAEAARVAAGALAEVVAEADARVTDAMARHRIVNAYFERLVSADLGGPVRRAVVRADDGGDELFDAIAAFLATAPPGLVDASDVVARSILRPPLDLWWRVPVATRRAYRRLLATTLATYPGVARHVRSPLVRRAMEALARSPDGRTPLPVAVLLTAHLPFGAVHLARSRRPRIPVAPRPTPHPQG